MRCFGVISTALLVVVGDTTWAASATPQRNAFAVAVDISAAAVTPETTHIDGALSQRRRRRPARRARPRKKPPAKLASPAQPQAPHTVEQPPPDLPQQYRAVGLLPMHVQDVAPAVVHRIEAALLAEVDDRKNMQGVAAQDVETEAAQYGLNAKSCEGNIRCIAQVGRYARTHLIIDTRLAALGGTLSIAMRLIDTQAGKELGRVGDPLSDSPEAQARELNALMLQLLAPEEFTGALLVQTSIPGAAIYIDEKFVGTTPLAEPTTGLKGGPHILRISKAGFRDRYQFVDVVHNRLNTIEVDLATNTIAGVIVEEASESGYGSLFVDTLEEGVDIRIDGEPRGRTRLEGPLPKLAAGKRRITFRAQDKEPLTLEVEIPAGRRVDMSMAVENGVLQAKVLQVVDEGAPLPGQDFPADRPLAKHDVEVERSEPPRTWRTTYGLIAAGTGIAGGAVGGLLAGLVSAQQKKADTLVHERGSGPLFPTQQDQLQAELRDISRRARGLEQGQWWAVGIGGTLAVVGGGLLLWDMLRQPSAQSHVDIEQAPQQSRSLIPFLWRSDSGLLGGVTARF